MHYLVTTLTMNKLPSQSKLREPALAKTFAVIRFYPQAFGRKIVKHLRRCYSVVITFYSSTKGNTLHQHIASLLHKLEITSAFIIPGVH